MENNRQEVIKLLELLRETDKSQQIGILMITEAINMMIMSNKKRRVNRRSRLGLP